MSTDERELLIANLSWWSGWCTDHENVLPELTRLGGRLLDARHMLAMDRPVIGPQSEETP